MLALAAAVENPGKGDKIAKEAHKTGAVAAGHSNTAKAQSSIAAVLAKTPGQNKAAIKQNHDSALKMHEVARDWHQKAAGQFKAAAQEFPADAERRQGLLAKANQHDSMAGSHVAAATVHGMAATQVQKDEKALLRQRGGAVRHGQGVTQLKRSNAVSRPARRPQQDGATPEVVIKVEQPAAAEYEVPVHTAPQYEVVEGETPEELYSQVRTFRPRHIAQGRPQFLRTVSQESEYDTVVDDEPRVEELYDMGAGGMVAVPPPPPRFPPPPAHAPEDEIVYEEFDDTEPEEVYDLVGTGRV